ncbi:glycoside hydrolase family 17 protein [Mollisia scopiformis]|uniref:Probable glucan endo-1,3-beta-glucosidase eglC n=1 Tax=Mollisia scopiformis TaxID=149040 RepID=A0A132B4B4_MOLSC|nr:glycoside hydrolase family 17 protein [Mollisia scopiformis]KUJ06507.1 glycoside hydrolase family 17 protein [Mollisia scopiformis]
MKFPTLALALAAAFTGADAYWKGFNNQANNVDGSCKSQAEYENDFNTMKSLPGYFTSMRLYASSDCNQLANAVPAALATGGQILVGIWTEDDDHYAAEKQALLSVVQTYGFDWMVAVSVGSEDLYRGDAPAWRIAQQIYDVRGMLSIQTGYSSNVQVGHVDTWTAWVDPNNEVVIQACDWVGTDGYPYYQGTYDNGIDNAYNLFWDSVYQVRDVVNAAHPGAWVWVTETGWPTAGASVNNAVPSIENAQAYWSQTICSSFAHGHTFVYVLQDGGDLPFGVVDSNFNPVYNLAC